MSGTRVRLAEVLDRLGVHHLLLRARARNIGPRYLTILTYHRIARGAAPGFDPDVADATPEEFERHVVMLKRYFTLVDTHDLVAHRAGGTLPPNAAMITFDDGYRDNHDTALPILRRHDGKGVFFVATGYLADRRLFWWERVAYHLIHATVDRLRLTYPEPLEMDLGTPSARERARGWLLRIVKDRPGLDLDRFLDELGAAAGAPLPRDEEARLADGLVMSWDHVRALRAAGMDVQSHTHRHRIINTLTEEELTADLSIARHTLEGQIDGPVHAVAYPSGRGLGAMDGPLRRAVQTAGYQIGFTTGGPLARVGGAIDWLQMPRLTVDGQTPDPFFRGVLAIPSLAY